MRPFLAAGLALASASLTAPASHAAPPGLCNGPPGANQLWQRPERFLVFGELRGTREGPSLLGEIICEAGYNGAVVVALEWPSDIQPALDAYMRSSGGAEARAALAAAFDPEDEDGAPTPALFDLLDRIRSVRSFGSVRVMGYLAPRKPGPVEAPAVSARLTSAPLPAEDAPPLSYRDARELGMAERIVASAGDAKRVIVLTGMSHAARRPVADPPFKPMSMHLPKGASLTLEMRHSGGDAWSCTQGACGVRTLTGGSADGEIRMLVLRQKSANGFDGVWAVGRVTASQPDAD